MSGIELMFTALAVFAMLFAVGFCCVKITNSME